MSNGKNRWYINLMSHSICCADSLISELVLANCLVGIGCRCRTAAANRFRPAMTSGMSVCRQRTQLALNRANGTLAADNRLADASLVVGWLTCGKPSAFCMATFISGTAVLWWNVQRTENMPCVVNSLAPMSNNMPLWCSGPLQNKTTKFPGRVS